MIHSDPLILGCGMRGGWRDADIAFRGPYP